MNIYFKETQFGTFCLLEKDLISNFISNYGYWEQHLFYFYSQFIKEEYIIIDGGANIGFHTVCFAALANKGKIYSFEPQPLIFNLLSTNILINGSTDIVNQFRLGLGETNNKLKMSPLKDQLFSEDCINYGGRSLTDLEEGEEEVEMTTIDNLNLDKLDFIKLDIQGFELEAIKGGEKTLKNNHPIFFLENYLDSIKDQKAIEILNKWGYEVYRLQIGNKEDCIAFYPPKHKTEIEIIKNQNQIPWTK
jgi:FkbM family methyltransferase